MFAIAGSVYAWNKQTDTDMAVNTVDTQIAAVEYIPLQSLPGTGIEAGQKFTTLSAGLFSNIVFFVIGIAIVLAVLMIVIGGIQYMGSDAYTSKEDAVKKINMALFGLLIAFGAWLLLNTINPDLVTFKVLEGNIDITTQNDGEESEYSIAKERTEKGYYIGNERFEDVGDCFRARAERKLPTTRDSCKLFTPKNSAEKGYYFGDERFDTPEKCRTAVSKDGLKLDPQTLQAAYISCGELK
mgnify:CR=1 FL=1